MLIQQMLFNANPQSVDTAITVAGGITVTSPIMRVHGDGGAVDITANPQIVAGTAGQMCVILGMSDANTVTLDNGTGITLTGNTPFVLKNGYSINLMYQTESSTWVELSRVATASYDINNGTIDGTTIGATSATTIKGTTIQATGAITGDTTMRLTNTLSLWVGLGGGTYDKIIFAATTCGADADRPAIFIGDGTDHQTIIWVDDNGAPRWKTGSDPTSDTDGTAM